MIIKRIPLFIIGLLYGAIINSCLLGLGYGLYAAGVAIGTILKALGECNFGNCNGGCEGLGAIIGAIALISIIGAAILGFATGILYGLVTGSWHCAMDFYNNGFLQGLTSPFKFLSARWSNDMNNNPDRLMAYYQSTDMNFWEQKNRAEEAIRRRAKKIDDTISEKVKPKPFPLPISQLIAVYELESQQIDDTPEMVNTIANLVEQNSLPQHMRIIRAGKTFDYLTHNEAAAVISDHSFFAESKSKSSANTYSFEFPTINKSLQTLRRHR